MKKLKKENVGNICLIVATIVSVVAVVVIGLAVNHASKRGELRKRAESWVETVAIKNDNKYLWTKARKECVVDAIMDDLSEKEINYLADHNLHLTDVVGQMRGVRLAQKLVNCYWAE